MLPAQEEALSLRDEPLPTLIEYPLSQVYRYDREIAELTGIPVNSIGPTMRRALDKLRGFFST